VLATAGMLLAGASPAAAAPCDVPIANEIACENTKPGNPASEWDVSGAGTAAIQGYATSISVNQGATVSFKVDTPASDYRLDIYRMGYYGGQGARRITTVQPSASLPQNQPACQNTAATGLIDCGNWAVSASWAVPADAVSGIYFAKLVREDGTAGSSHVVFVVRDDDGGSDLLFQTSDTTWQAYNQYGGNSLYTGNPAGRAYKVSYNRPFTTRGTGAEDWVFNAEYPMVRWLERNGYDVSYTSGLDTDRSPAELLEHRSFLSVGHDEYWSGAQRANVEAARAAGVNLAFFSGNEVFWKTRWEDGGRTLVTYKETHANAKIDPQLTTWTGTWRDPRFSPPADGGKPENALTGQLFSVNAGATTAIRVPAADGKMRFWRNTTIATQAAGATATLPDGTLGYEWDMDPDNGFRPAGAFRLSATSVANAPGLVDYGSTFSPQTIEHNMTLYRAASGARVFGAGTVQWAWGLDASHDRGSAAADVRMQQATLNLLADMGAQPSTLQSGLVAATASADATRPTSAITAPANNGTVQPNSTVTIGGTAADTGGGVVGGVEVSTDGGESWHRANGRAAWTYSWNVGSGGTYNLRSRAVDDSGNLETVGAGITVTAGSGSATCPCTIWGTGATPDKPAETGDTSPIEVGTKFRTTTAGKVAGVRFYKGATNTGTHVGHLWSRTGALLGTVTFSNETASGWQQARFATPIDVAANTTYVISYFAPNGNYASSVDYFAAAGVDNGPLRALRDAEDGGNGVYRYGASGSFPDSTWRSENYWVDVLLETGPVAPDTTPPTVAEVTPARGATGIATGVNATARFSEPMTPSTVTASTVTMRDASGTAVPGSVSYDAASQTATFDPTAALTGSATYTVTVKGGTAGVKDAAGNPLATDDAWTFMTRAVTSSGCPCSIWAPSARPAKEAENDSAAVEVGTRFRSDVDGLVTGIRFYKGATNTGTHVGHLWSNSGQLLATATFTGESASGWQEVSLSAPVAITAGTTYVVSYHAPRGNYAVNDQQFLSAGVDNAPLHALRNGVDGGNGVYGYGASGTFPNGVYRSEGYWVDVVFETESGPDTRPPTITSRLPAPDTAGVAPTASASASFSEGMSAASITTATVQLRDPDGNLVPAAVTYDNGARAATLDPNGELAGATRYTVTVKGGASGVKDVAGNPLAADESWSFTTAVPPGPGPDEGPGGPVLVIAKASNPFTRYYAEILRAEGLNAFKVTDIANVTPAVLANYDAAILGDMALTAAQVSTLTTWVNGGGDLIAMRPDKQLAGLLGLTDQGATLANAYLRVDTSQAPGAGIESATMQYHGGADRYALAGATAVASLYSNASTATTAPAVTMRSVGTNGGRAAAFTYDLARSVVLTRQGNPAWVGQDRDGQAPLRSDDLFFGAMTGDNQPDWVDRSKVAIPQADEQQRLLANLLGTMTQDKKPMPRFWYFPRALKAVVIMTGDDHAAPGSTASRFAEFTAASPAGCSLANWECIRGTSYVYPNTNLTNTQANTYAAQGFEVGLHLTTSCGDYTRAQIQDYWDSQMDDWRRKYTTLPNPITLRTHCIAWSGWVTTPQFEADNGMRLDANYYYWPDTWVNNVPGMFTGSGMPMRFADTDGTMLDVYQSTTQMTDESGQTFPFTIDTLLNRALGAQGYYGAFNANMHTDISSAGATSIVASAKARGVPVVSAQQMLTWLDGRNASTFEQIAYSGDQLSFRVTAGAGATGLRGMVPASYGGKSLLSMTRDGAPLAYTRETIKGVEYAFFASTTGAYTASYGADTTAPGITARTVVPAADGTATVTWTTDEASDSRVDYGTSAGSLTLNQADAARVTAHSVRLTGLTPGTTYHYRVRSADAADNATTQPAAPAAPATFRIPQTVTATPAAVTIDAGTLRAGAVSALSADDNVYYQVNSTTSGTRTTSYYGSFTGVPTTITSLTATHRGRNSGSCTQVIQIYRWTDGTWQQLNSGALADTETTRGPYTPAGAATGYVSGTGEVRVRVRCTRTANFFASGEQMQITYVVP
jgi:hypothetical protein